MKTTLISIAIVVFVFSFSACESIWPYEESNPECPVVESISPAGAKFGEVVTVTGRNFFTGKPELHQVFIGDELVPSGNILSVDDSQTLRFKVPAGIVNGEVKVGFVNLKCNNSQQNGPMFTYYYTATMVSKLAGTQLMSNCGNVADDCLFAPSGIDLDNEGNIIVADKFNHVIRKISPSGNISATYGKFKMPGCDDFAVANNANVSLRNPIDVAVNASGDIYVAEENNSTIRVLLKSGSANLFAGRCEISEFVDGPCLSARISVPYNLTVYENTIYFIDNGRIRSIADGCSISTILQNSPTQYFKAIEVSSSRSGQGPIFIADELERNIKSVGINGGVTPLTASNSPLSQPAALAMDSRGNIFIADKGKNQIYVLCTDGNLLLIAGTESNGYTNGTGLIAQFRSPSGLALDELNQILYVADTDNHVIRKIVLQ